MKQKKLTAAIIALMGASASNAQSEAEPLYLNFSRPEMQFQETRAYSILSVNTPFSITLNFTGGLTESQKAVFEQAKAAWESRLTGYQPGISVSGVTIEASSQYIDGPSKILGQAGPTNYTSQAGYTLSVKGQMEFDSADMADMEQNGTLPAVIEHEMGHVLGIGTLWEDNNVYSLDSFQYIGTHAIDAWNAEFIAPAAPMAYVPVENEGGDGTRNGHWDETAGGGLTGYTDDQGRDMRNELMTGWINTPVFFSDTTLYSMRDLGFTINTAQPQVDLSISPNNGGKVIWPNGDCDQNCNQSFSVNTVISLEAIADYQYYFAGWSGDCSGDESCNLVMDTNKSITANFQLRPEPVMQCVTANDDISGNYAQDTLIQSADTITLTPAITIAKRVRLSVESATAIAFGNGFNASKYAQISADVVAGLSCDPQS